MKMKMVLTALGLAALLATPALAAKQTHRARATTAVTAPAITSEGQLIGTDPDPSVRSELSRDATTYTSTN